MSRARWIATSAWPWKNTCPAALTARQTWRCGSRSRLKSRPIDQTVAAPRGMADRALAQGAPAAGRRRGLDASAWGISASCCARRCRWSTAKSGRLRPLVIGLGFIAALIAEQAGFVYALAPLIAAACVSLIYGPENDPAYELTLSTPTSPRQILLARLVLVFGYNLALVIVAMLALLPALPDQQPVLGTLALTWLAPMTFLSAAALALSLWIGATNAISITYVAWLAQFLAGPLLSPQAALQIGVRSLTRQWRR